jgi:acetate kinase
MASRRIDAAANLTTMPENAILVINSGSSSLKFGVYSTDLTALPFVGAGLAPPGVRSNHGLGAEAIARPIYRGEIEGIGGGEGKIWLKDASGKTLEEESRNFAQQSDAAKAVSEKLAKIKLPKLEGIGHRVVHGGPSLTAHQRITPQVLQTLEAAAHISRRCTCQLRLP